MKSLYTLLGLFFLILGSAKGEILDTSLFPDTGRYYFFLPEALDFASFNPSPFEVTADGFHNDNPNMQMFGTFVNDQRISLFPHRGRLNASTSLGNFGTPSNSMIFETNNELGANLINNAFDNYLFDRNRMRFYQVKSPLTELYYIGGAKKEQLFQVLHTQNINQYINMGIEFRTSGSEGFYRRQETNLENFRAFLSAKSKNNKYRILAHTIWNSINVNENGGIMADSLFETGENITKSTIAVNLLDAHSQRSNQAYYIRQCIDAGSSISKAVNDTAFEIVFIPKHRFSHTISYHNWSNYYIDNNPDSSNYVLFLNDADYTSNHAFSDKLKNQLDWITLNDTSVNSIKVYSGLIHELNRFKQNEIDSNFNNLIYSGALGNNPLSKLHWKVSGGYGLIGGNQGDLNSLLHLDIKFKELSNQFNIDVGLALRSASLIQTVYSGNHFQWVNDFSKTRSDFLKLSYLIKKHRFNLGFKVTQIQNFIYNNELAMPEQDSNLITIVSGLLCKDFKWNKVGIRNTLIYQKTGDFAALHLPSFLLYNALYYESWIFKKALFLQIGVDVFFNTEYYSDAYMPSSGLFYLQSNKKVGNYPYLNFFINFKVSQARVFFKIAHLNQGYIGNTYYSVPHYPMADRSFKVGISWLFYD